MILRAESLTPTQITASPVIDSLLKKFDLIGDAPIDIAREQFRRKISVTVNRNEKLMSIAVSGRTPELAQTVANSLLLGILENSKPEGFVREQIVTQLQLAEKRAKESSVMLAHLATRIGTAGFTPGSSDAIQGYAELQKVSADAQAQVLSAQAKLEGLTNSSIIQNPTIMHADNTKKVILLFLLTVIIVGIALFMFVFLRHSYRQLSVDSGDREKLTHIKKVLGL